MSQQVTLIQRLFVYSSLLDLRVDKTLLITYFVNVFFDRHFQIYINVKRPKFSYQIYVFITLPFMSLLSVQINVMFTNGVAILFL